MSDLISRTVDGTLRREPERKVSKWLRIRGEREYVCQECGQLCLETVMWIPKWKYCPNCGAYMGDEND